MPKQRAPVECRLKKNPTIVKIFFLRVDEQPPNTDWERVPEKHLDEFYRSGSSRSQQLWHRRDQ